MKKPKQFIRSEYLEQCEIFAFAQIMIATNQYPELVLLNGSPNGVKMSIGQAVKAKNNGLKRGYPDIFLPVARGGYHGLFIELKRVKGGVLSQYQKQWLNDLTDQGYFACVCRGADAAKRLLVKYLDDEVE